MIQITDKFHEWIGNERDRENAKQVTPDPFDGHGKFAMMNEMDKTNICKHLNCKLVSKFGHTHANTVK